MGHRLVLWRTQTLARGLSCTRAANWEVAGSVFPMEATIDSVGRIVLPKPLRDALDLLPGATVDVSFYGAGLQILPSGRTARIVDVDGALVADSDIALTDDVVFGPIDSLRR